MCGCLGGLDALHERIREASRLADLVTKNSVEARGSKFGQWVRDKAEWGAGLLHKFTKPRVPWKADGAVSFAGVAPSVATLQDVVNGQAKG